MNEHYYKVVTVDNTSVGYEIQKSKYGLKYELNVSVKPLIGKIFIFDTYENAKQFMILESSGRYPLKMLKVTATNVTKPNSYIPSQFNCKPDQLEVYWSDYNAAMFATKRVPDGTLLADEVTPVENVDII